MRQVEFRGWSELENKWVVGSLLQSEIDVNEISVKCEIHERFAHDFSISKYDVVPKSVGEFAGIKDKKNVRVFEGDKINCLKGNLKFGATETIEFKKGCFILRHRDMPISEFLSIDDCFEIEVIGNIYETPQLITN